MGLTGLRPKSGRKEKSKSSKRKLEKKHDFYEKDGVNHGQVGYRINPIRMQVKDSAISLGAKKSISKQSKESKETKFKLNCKSSLKLVERESLQLKAVINHPVFQSDPLAAIHQHLEKTQPLINQEKQLKKTKKQPKKKGKKGQSSGSQAMDI